MNNIKKMTKVSKKDVILMQNSDYAFSQDKLMYTCAAQDFFSPFLIKTNVNDNTYVDLRYYSGSDHGRYAGKTFKQLINSMKKLERNLDSLIYSSEYYFSDSKKRISYYRINGRYYLTSDGNHRSIIAKHLFAYLGIKPYLFGVDVVDFVLDMKRFYYFHALKKILKRNYGGIWKVGASSNINSIKCKYGDVCRYRIVIFQEWDYVFSLKWSKLQYMSSKEHQLNGFVFDNDNIHILYQFLDMKLGRGLGDNHSMFSPVFILEALLSKKLNGKSSYGYQSRYNWYEDDALRSPTSSRELIHGSYLYLCDHLPVYNVYEYFYLIYKYKLYQNPIAILKQFIAYVEKIRKIASKLSWSVSPASLETE